MLLQVTQIGDMDLLDAFTLPDGVNQAQVSFTFGLNLSNKHNLSFFHHILKRYLSTCQGKSVKKAKIVSTTAYRQFSWLSPS
jgi:hypothetical protein